MACKCGPTKDGGVPFTFMKMVTEEEINAADTATNKLQGEAYFQIQTAYAGGPGNLELVNNDARFVWCSVTHLG